MQLVRMNLEMNALMEKRHPPHPIINRITGIDLQKKTALFLKNHPVTRFDRAKEAVHVMGQAIREPSAVVVTVDALQFSITDH